MKKNTNWLILVLGLVLLLGLGQAAQAALVPPPGPNNPATTTGTSGGIFGFPLWYQDTNDLRLELCLPNAAELAAGACLAAPPGPLPIVFPTNFPDEAFWFAAEAFLPAPADGLLVLALEAAFAGGGVVEGDQIVFGRLRYRITVPLPGQYTVTTPYGIFIEDVPVGATTINVSRDIGIGTPGVFTGALASDIGPFLLASATPGGAPLPLFDGSALRPGALYLLNPALPDTFVTGAVPPNLNSFRVDGPAGSNFGGPGVDFIQVDRFTLQGRVFSGLVPTSLSGLRATYSRPIVGTGFVDALANSAATAVVTITDATGDIPTTIMITDPASGNFSARIPITQSTLLPASLAVTADNTATNPLNTPTSLGVNLVDRVTVTSAEYNAFVRTLTIQAVSSDEVSPPDLTATGFGNLISGKITVNNVNVPPAAVTVTSSKGGSGAKDVISIPPVSGARATYCRPAVGNGRADVFAASAPTAVMTITDPTAQFLPSPMLMVTDLNSGNFFAEIPVTGTTILPSGLIITATSPSPGIAPVGIGVDLTDVVTISSAEYVPLEKTLTIRANSCDALAPPVLTAVGFGNLVSGNLIIKNVNAPPSVITVTSSGGGSDTKAVTIGNLKRYLPTIMK
jgi:hypothetical protein